MEQKELEEVELDLGQCDDPLAAPGLAGGQVEGEVLEAQHLVVGDRCAPPEQGPEPSEELREVEGLDEVVIGPGIETSHAVADRITCGEHQHRRPIPERSKPTADLEAVDVRQLEVEHHGIGCGLGERPDRFGAVGGDVDLVALEDEGALERVPDRLVVIDHQDAHLISSSLPRRDYRGLPHRAALGLRILRWWPGPGCSTRRSMRHRRPGLSWRPRRLASSRRRSHPWSRW